MSNTNSLFSSFQQVSADLEEMSKAQSEYLTKAVDCHLDMQKRHCELAAQILENHMEYCAKYLTDLQETISSHGLHRLTLLAKDKPRKAA